MRIFVAGASGVLGMKLVPLLVHGGHLVTSMTRSPEKADRLRALGADPVVCDVFDAPGLARSMSDAAPDVVLDELTDLPDAASEIPDFRARNDRMRTEGTTNLVNATRPGAPLISQSIAWEHPNAQARAAVAEHERLVLAAGGTVLRYGQLYGPGTYYAVDPPSHPRIHIDEAVRRTVDALDAPPGILVLTEASD